MAVKCEVVVKLGGCAVSDKSSFETVRLEAITAAAKMVKEIKGNCIVVHGAGSFGHFQAHQYGTAHGLSNDPIRGRVGFAKTRLSVTKLQHIITEVLVENGVPAVGVSPCGTWLTSGRCITRSSVGPIVELLEAGFVPVIHGDCVLDTEQGCSILSGDRIIERLACELFPRRVVFLTDVNGIYDKPPENEDAILLQKVVVKSDGTLAVAIATSRLLHDVTGGLREKLQTALSIILSCKGRTRCFVANIFSTSAYSVCVNGMLDGDGTEIVGDFEKPSDSGPKEVVS